MMMTRQRYGLLYAVLSTVVISSPALTLETSTNSTRTSTTASASYNFRNISSSTIESTNAVGDYIAAGLGISSSLSSTSHDTSTVNLSLSQSLSHAQGSTTSSYANISTAATIATTAVPIKSSTAGRVLNTTLATSGVSVYQNVSSSNATAGSFNYTGDCWARWNEYWSVLVFDWSIETVKSTYTAWTYLETDTSVSQRIVGSYTNGLTTGFLTTLTLSSSSGSALSAVETVTSTFSTTKSGTGYVYSPVTTFTYIGDSQYFSGNTFDVPATITSAVAPPACVLPSIVPQCQSQWDAFYANSSDYQPVLPFACTYTDSALCSSASSSWSAGVSRWWVKPGRDPRGSPYCTQASAGTAVCSSLVIAYEKAQEFDSGIEDEVALPKWNVSSVLAPGCSLGCGGCAITGNSVRLYYWPPMTATQKPNASGIALPTITSQPHETVTALVLDNGTSYTFTSPTIYISYAMLYASDRCSNIGPTYRNTILPLSNSHDLSSIGITGFSDIAGYTTLPFNLTDLVSPIPLSISSKDVRCQANSIMLAGVHCERAWESMWVSGGKTYSTMGTSFIEDNCETAVCSFTGPYAPIIAVPAQLTELNPEWRTCTGYYSGIYDPPTALQPAPVLATPTQPSAILATMTTSAAPSSTGGDGLPSVTEGAVTTSKSSQSDDPRPSDTSLAVSTPLASPSTPLLSPSTPLASQSTPPATSEDSASSDHDPSYAVSGSIAGDHTQPRSSSADTGVRTSTDADPGGATEVITFAGVTYSALVDGTKIIPYSSAAQGMGSDTSAADPQTEIITTAQSKASNPLAATASANPQTEILTTAQGMASSVQAAIAPGDSQTELITTGGLTLTVVQDQDPSSPATAFINGQPLAVGEATSLSGLVVSLGTGGVAIGDPTAIALSPTHFSTVVTMGGTSITVVQTQVSGSAQLVALAQHSTISLAPGEVGTIGGQVMSAQSSGGIVLSGDAGTSTLFAARPSTAAGAQDPKTTVLTFAGRPLTILPAPNGSGGAGVNGITITTGSRATTIEGIVVSNGNCLVLASGGLATAVQTTNTSAQAGRTSTSSFASTSAVAGSSPSKKSDASELKLNIVLVVIMFAALLCL